MGTLLPEDAGSLEELKKALEALKLSAWTELTLGAKIEETALQQTVRARTEGSLVRLRGAPIVKAGEELKAGETLATLPAAFHPPKRVLLSANSDAAGAITANLILIATTGVMTLEKALVAEAFLPFDGLSFSLT